MAGRPRAVDVRGPVRPGVGEPERVEDAFLHLLRPAPAGHGLDDLAEQGVADVGVLEPDVGAGHRSLGQHPLGEGVGIEERRLVLPVGAARGVPRDAARVGQQLEEGQVGHRRVAVVQPVQAGTDRVVEAEMPLLHHLRQHRRGHRLGVRGDPEAMRRSQRLPRRLVGDAVRGREDELAVEPDGGLYSGDAGGALAERQPAVGVADRIVDGGTGDRMGAHGRRC